MAMIFLTAGILARRLPALLSRRRAASLPLLPIGGDTVPGSPVSSRGSPIFAPSHQLPATWAPLQSPPPAPPAHRPPCCPLPALPAPTCLSWRRPDLRSRATVRRTRRLRIIGRPPATSRCRKRDDTVVLVRILPPWHSRLLHLRARGSR